MSASAVSAITAAGMMVAVTASAGILILVWAVFLARLAVLTNAVSILIKIGTAFSAHMSFLGDRILSAGLVSMSQGRDCKS